MIDRYNHVSDSIRREFTNDENEARQILENWGRWARQAGIRQLWYPGLSVMPETQNSGGLGIDALDAEKAERALLRVKKDRKQTAKLLVMMFCYGYSGREAAKKLKIGKDSLRIYCKIGLTLFLDNYRQC